MESVCRSGALFKDRVQHGYNLLCKLHVQDGSGFRNFVRMTKSDFEILLQKFDNRIRRKGTKFHEEVPASIRLAVQFRYLACGDFLLNFNITDSNYITVSVICTCTSHKHALSCRSSITVKSLSFGHMLTAQILQTN